MIDTILAEKKEMSQTFVEGTRVPVTVVKLSPNIVTQVKKKVKDGYWAVQLGIGERKTKNLTKPMKGHLKGATKDKMAPSFLKEVKLATEPELKVGDKVDGLSIFKKGDIVSVTGVSKGKGFAGVVKRWGFAGGPRTHGQSDRLRAPGSIGQGTTPGRVFKGKKMAGRMGGEVITIKNLQIVSIDSEKAEILLSGPIPGANGDKLVLRRISKGSLSDLVEEVAAPQAQKEPEEGEEAKEGEKKEDQK